MGTRAEPFGESAGHYRVVAGAKQFQDALAGFLILLDQLSRIKGAEVVGADLDEGVGEVLRRLHLGRRRLCPGEAGPGRVP